MTDRYDVQYYDEHVEKRGPKKRYIAVEDTLMQEGLVSDTLRQFA